MEFWLLAGILLLCVCATAATKPWLNTIAGSFAAGDPCVVSESPLRCRQQLDQMIRVVAIQITDFPPPNNLTAAQEAKARIPLDHDLL